MEDASLDDFLETGDAGDDADGGGDGDAGTRGSPDGGNADGERAVDGESDGGTAGDGQRDEGHGDGGVSDGRDAEGTPDQHRAVSPGTVAPAASTYQWSPGEVACEACGETVEGRWRAPAGLVCADCKDWSGSRREG